jgi:hypothetical protein
VSHGIDWRDATDALTLAERIHFAILARGALDLAGLRAAIPDAHRVSVSNETTKLVRLGELVAINDGPRLTRYARRATHEPDRSIRWWLSASLDEVAP